MLATRDAPAESEDEGTKSAGTQRTDLILLSSCSAQSLSPLSLLQVMQFLSCAALSDRSLSPTDLCHSSPLSYFPEINYLLCTAPYSSGLQPFDLQPPAPSPASAASRLCKGMALLLLIKQRGVKPRGMLGGFWAGPALLWGAVVPLLWSISSIELLLCESRGAYWVQEACSWRRSRRS